MIHETRDCDLLAAFFRRDPGLYIYQLGDLDPFFFRATRWWITQENDITSALLLYSAFETPVIQAITDNDDQGRLWEALLADLPARAHVHYLRRHEPVIRQRYRIQHLGAHHKMTWDRHAPSASVKPATDGQVRALTIDDRNLIHDLHRAAYPHGYVDERTLSLKRATGVFVGTLLVAIAACHVYSPSYSVAAIGSVATHPDYRRRGFCSAATKALLDLLAGDVGTIGLNVHADNATAIRIYEGLGFKHCLDYEEAIIESA